MDLLLNRYGNIEYLMNLDFSDGRDIMFKAVEKDREDRIWQLWVQLYPHMDKDNFKPFDEFLNMFKPSNKPSNVNQTKEELVAEIERVKTIHQAQIKKISK